MGIRRIPVEQRIDEGVLKVEYPENACWPWLGAKDQNGYGIVMRFTYGKWKTTKAHRLAYEVWTGRKLEKGKPLLHSCDNPPCCRPGHLKYGTQLENIADCVSKDRHARGERNGHSKLTDAIVHTIRRLLRFNVPQSVIAKRFGISQSHVTHINRGDIWRHI
jgi:hypothetical protein